MERVAAVIRARAVRMMLERSGITPNGIAREPCSIRRANFCKMSTSATQIYRVNSEVQLIYVYICVIYIQCHSSIYIVDFTDLRYITDFPIAWIAVF